MALFGVKVSETLEKTFIVEADSYIDAEKIINQAYHDGDIILLDTEKTEHDIDESITFGTNPIDKGDPRLDCFTKFHTK